MAAAWATGSDAGGATSQRWLWITPELADDLGTGALTYSLGLAGAVADRGFDVTMVGAVRRPLARTNHARAGAISYEAVDASFRRPWQSLGSPLPNQAFACAVPGVRSRVEVLLERDEWDVLVIDGLQAAWVTPLLERRRAAPVIVYVAHNHESSMRREVADAVQWTSPRRPVLELEARKTRRLERRTVHLADVVSSITDADRRRFEAEAPNAVHVVVPPGWSGEAPERPVPLGDRPRRAGILGSFEWHVKQEGLRRFLRAADPIFHEADVELHVAGRIPDEFRSEVEPGLRATRLLGWVDDSAEFLGQCRIGVVSESLGGGFKLKALDYVFNEVPLACLTHNLAGLPLVGGEHAVAAPDEEQLARSIVAVIDDVDRLDRYAAQALHRCRAQFSWAAAADRLVDATAAAR